MALPRFFFAVLKRPSLCLSVRVNDETVSRFQRMIDQNPANGLARFSLAKALYDLERFREAADHFRVAVEVKPEFMLGHILLGKCALALGDIPAAKVALERGLSLAISQHHDGPQAELENLLADL